MICLNKQTTMRNLFSTVVVAASLALSLTSCLKDDEHFVDFAGAGYVAEIPYTANRSILQTDSLSASTATSVFPLDINIASPNPPTQNIDIAVMVDQAALTTYNTGRTIKYTLLPSSAYQLTPAVTVNAGSRIGTVNITFQHSQVPKIGGPYALPITIQTVPSNVTISANYRTQIIAVPLKK